MMDIDLFAGAGGLALGLEEAGFRPVQLYEFDKVSCETLRYNAKGPGTLDASICESDVRLVDWSRVQSPVRLLAAGAPCQPFSLAGRHRAEHDGRNLFPEVLRAVRALRPAAVLLENVKGLLRPSFQTYFDYVIRQLESPFLRPKPEELWQNHDQRLRRQRCSPSFQPAYRIAWQLLDAADFGVPQTRQRVFIVATRNDIEPFPFPRPTHSKHSLLRSQASGLYWKRHGLRPKRILGGNGLPLDLDDSRRPWMTVRDAIVDLPTPSKSEQDAWMNHWSIPGARSYAGHVGSSLDLPSKTIKAGVHGVPGGENTVIDSDGRVRYYTLREIARIQTFPDEHFFVGARIHVTRQVGNAVPSRLAAAVGRPLFSLLARSLGAKGVSHDV